MAGVSQLASSWVVCSGLLKYLIGLTVLSVLFTSSLVVFLPFVLLRRLVFHSAKIFRPDLGKMVDARGTLALIDDVYQSPRGKMIVGYVVEGCPSLEDLRYAVTHTLEAKDSNISNNQLLHPELSQSVSTWMGFPFWTPIKDFQVSDHVSLCDVMWADQSRATEYMKSLSLKPFSPDKPLWKISLIPQFHPNTNSCSHYIPGSSYSFLILEAHHSLVDGFSLMKLVFKFFRVSNKLPDLPEGPLRHKPWTLRLYFQLMSLLKVPHDIGTAAFKRSRDGHVWTVKNKPNLTLPHCPSEHHGYSSATSDLIPFSRIKEIRLKHKVSTLAVISAAISGAIRKEMFRERKHIPHKLKFGVILELPRHPDKLRNHWTGAPFALAIGEPDPVTRLLKINRRLSQVKRSSLPSLAAYLGILVGSVPPSLTRNFLTKPVSSSHIAVLSSFPGPQEQMILFNSHKCPEGFGICSAMMGTTTVAFSFVTYAGYGRLMIGADTSIIPTDFQASAITHEFANQLDILLTSKSQLQESV